MILPKFLCLGFLDYSKYFKIKQTIWVLIFWGDKMETLARNGLIKVFSPCAKFSEKLTFLTPLIRTRVRIRG